MSKNSRKGSNSAQAHNGSQSQEKQMSQKKPEAPKGALKFATSTFGTKKAAPVTEDRLEALRKLHAEMCDKAEDGTDIYPSKTAFVVAASKAGFNTREIAELLGQKPAVVYSMIWRVTHDYKPKPKAKVEGGAASAAGSDEPEADEPGADAALGIGADSELTDDELSEL